MASLPPLTDVWTDKILQPSLDSPGYVVSIWPLIRANGGSQLLSTYNSFSEKMEEFIPDFAELYPPSALHVTIATLASFIDTSVDTAQLDEDMLRRFLDRAREDPAWPEMDQLTVDICQPTLNQEGVVGFFFNKCPAITDLRECMKRAAVGTPIENRIKCPGIVHSTFLRFSRAGHDDQKFRERFAEVAKTWESVQISVDLVDLVRESSPYMHMVLPAKRHIVHSVPVSL